MAVVPDACTRVKDWNLVPLGLVRAKWTLVTESKWEKNHNLREKQQGERNKLLQERWPGSELTLWKLSVYPVINFSPKEKLQLESEAEDYQVYPYKDT